MIVYEQAQLLLAMAACGAMMGAVYDAMGALRHVLRGGEAAQAFLDLIFGLLSAAAMIATGLYLGEPPFRFFAFAGMGFGFAVYMTTLGTIVRILHRMTYKFVKKS